jgi:hypothetical protein
MELGIATDAGRCRLPQRRPEQVVGVQFAGERVPASLEAVDVGLAERGRVRAVETGPGRLAQRFGRPLGVRRRQRVDHVTDGRTAAPGRDEPVVRR